MPSNQLVLFSEPEERIATEGDEQGDEQRRKKTKEGNTPLDLSVGM